MCRRAHASENDRRKLAAASIAERDCLLWIQRQRLAGSKAREIDAVRNDAEIARVYAG